MAVTTAADGAPVISESDPAFRSHDLLYLLMAADSEESEIVVQVMHHSHQRPRVVILLSLAQVSALCWPSAQGPRF
jgi:hypothetical protein